MIRILDLAQNEIDLSQYGLKCLSFIPESPSPRFTEEELDNTDGSLILGTTLDKRKLSAKFFMQSYDHIDFQLARDEIYRLLDPRKDLYIIDIRQPGKRWKVRTSASFKPDYINPYLGSFDIEFVSPIPFAESIGTTLDPFTFDAEKWQFGQGLTEDELTYTQTVNSFKIYNAGTETIDPRQFPLTIKYNGASTNLTIKNNTTLDTWQYTGTTSASDTLEINRTRSLKNSVVNVFKDTNRKLITLAPGWNDIELTGTSGSFEISFDFRFYYL
ncbi:phage tail family protein [Peribacillus kribbensis]|uniref:phage tail family protein n=1 Tax=Peribacillus kribbensis TaxID=356658 RepID=UPI0003FFBFF2|nr:phage tail family protein [Peribacillus kribbensis]